MRTHAVAMAAAFSLLAGAQAANLIGQSTAPILQEAAKEQQKHLRLCNAYAHSGHLDVVMERTGKSLGTLQYKECRDVSLLLNGGDLLSFSIEGPKTPRLSVGGFALTDLPTTLELPLLLAVERRSSKSLRARFQSHAFAADARDSAQVAVMDTYLGEGGLSAKALRIAEVLRGAQLAEMPQQIQRTQELALNSVAVVNPGEYQVMLDNTAGTALAGMAPAANLTAKAGVSYVVLRVGDGGPQKDASTSFPEEVVVFPPPDVPERSSFAALMASAYSWVNDWVPK